MPFEHTHRVNLAEENAHLRKQLEAGIGESSEVRSTNEDGTRTGLTLFVWS